MKDDMPINIGSTVMVRDDIDDSTDDYDFIKTLAGNIYKVVKISRNFHTNRIEFLYVEDEDGKALIGSNGDKFCFYPEEVRRI
jgi:hypothetical protein